MQPTADLLLDRKRLKRQLSSWRFLALLSVFGAAAVLLGGVGGYGKSPIKADYIAQVSIEDVMVDDTKRDKMLKDLRDDAHAKAVIVQLDSPGGTTVAGEEVYLQLKEISQKKPVVGVMRTLCASACYMASLGTTHVVAREGTLTGSIGVLMQSMEISRLADKLGITPITIKSGAMKDAPSFTEPFTPEQRSVVSEVVTDAYDHFVRLIVERRGLDEAVVRKIADGRVYTGNQALKLELIDGLGGTDEAVNWLQTNRRLSKKLEVVKIEPEQELASVWDELAQSTGIKIFSRSAVGLDGLVSIWHPSVIQ